MRFCAAFGELRGRGGSFSSFGNVTVATPLDNVHEGMRTTTQTCLWRACVMLGGQRCAIGFGAEPACVAGPVPIDPRGTGGAASSSDIFTGERIPVATSADEIPKLWRCC